MAVDSVGEYRTRRVAAEPKGEALKADAEHRTGRVAAEPEAGALKGGPRPLDLGEEEHPSVAARAGLNDGAPHNAASEPTQESMPHPGDAWSHGGLRHNAASEVPRVATQGEALPPEAALRDAGPPGDGAEPALLDGAPPQNAASEPPRAGTEGEALPPGAAMCDSAPPRDAASKLPTAGTTGEALPPSAAGLQSAQAPGAPPHNGVPVEARPSKAVTALFDGVVSKQKSEAAVETVQLGGKGRSATERGGASEQSVLIGRFLAAAGQGSVEEIRRMVLRGHVSVNQADYDGRTALHLACSEGKADAARALLDLGADANPKDRFGNTPMADAQSYGSVEICRMLKKSGGMVSQALDASGGKRPQILKDQYELDLADLHLANATEIGKGLFGDVRKVSWKGTPVAVKVLPHGIRRDQRAEAQFREELRILQRLRHPNIVQFLGAVTKSEPRMLVTEYLSQGNLYQELKRKGPLHAHEAVRYALDIARGMNYLHQHKPQPVIHRGLNPHNLLRDEAGQLKVSDFGLSRIRVEAHDVSGRTDSMHNASSAMMFISGSPNSYKYLAPEAFHDACAGPAPQVDVFSFGVIVHEIGEGRGSRGKMVFKSPLHARDTMFEGLQTPKFKAGEAEGYYATHDGVSLRFRSHRYPAGMKQLISQSCKTNPKIRPTFVEIIDRLAQMEQDLLSAPEPQPPMCGCSIL